MPGCAAPWGRFDDLGDKYARRVEIGQVWCVHSVRTCGQKPAFSNVPHRRLYDGWIYLHRFRHPQKAVAAGLAMVTEDRKENGLLLPQSIRCNTSLAALRNRFSTAGVLRGREEDSAARHQCESLDVRCTDTEQRVGTLSGGNQQKVAIARWLVRGADIFLFDEPTRGIDVAARRRIYRLLDALAEQGKGTVIVSSDSEELQEVSDRIAVMSGGRLVETFTRADWSAERIMQASFTEYRDRRAPE